MMDLNIRAQSVQKLAMATKILGFFVTEFDENGEDIDIPAPGVNVSYIGKVVMKSAVLDEQGQVVTPAVLSKQVHANIRIQNDVLEIAHAKLMEDAVKENKLANKNKNEIAWKYLGIEFIDMSTVNTPVNVWL